MAARALLLCLLASACVHTGRVVHDENTDRIDAEMKREVYSENIPGAQGIVLGPDAPPLAAVSVNEESIFGNNYGRSGAGYGNGYGYGPFIGGTRLGRGARIGYGGLDGNNGQMFGGGTAGGSPHGNPVGGQAFGGGTSGGSPHGTSSGSRGGGFGGGGHGFGGGGHGHH